MNNKTKFILTSLGIAAVGAAALNESGIYQKESMVMSPKKISIPRLGVAIFGGLIIANLVYMSVKKIAS